MGRRFARGVSLVLALALLGGASISQADPLAQQQGRGAPLRLKAAIFTPTAGQAPALPAGLTIGGYAQGQRGTYIVQFAGPVLETWKSQVVATGAELLDYLPDFAFKVRMTPAQAQQVEALDAVGWVGIYQPAYKLSPSLVRSGTGLYRVRAERGVSAAQAETALRATGAAVTRSGPDLFTVAATSAQLDAMARHLDVAWIESYPMRQKHNEYGAGGIIGGTTANTNGYDGAGQIAAVADTGIGNGTAAGAHPDIPSSRVTAIYNRPGATDSCFNSIADDGAQDVDSGHGTHVAGSVLSDGGASGEGKGTAPAASLVFQAIENWATTSGLCKAAGYPDGYYLVGLPADLRQLYQQAYDAGARVHSNSWGSDANGDYTADSANTDDFVWTRPTMTITFSAGNAGKDANNDGLVDSDSTGSPATAKNVITVGASENDRGGNYQCDLGLTYESHDAYQKDADGTGKTCAEMGGQNVLGTGSRWSFNTEPLKSDPSAGNREQMALFSSRGPTDDGRIKPDVVAPGTWILSGYSGQYQEGYGDPTNPKNAAYQWDGWGMPLNGAYKYMGGTSMSNPVAAGAAAVVRHYYQKAHAHNASAALVKATLINTAVDMLDENNDGVSDNDFPIPNVHEGWGRVDLANATDGTHRFLDNAAKTLATNASLTYTFSVTTAKPVRVSLVWSDFASTEAAAKNLVNDLDLEVTAPGGAIYRGNVFAGGWSQTGGSADRTNNVENVYVQNGAAGTWTVKVLGYNVPKGPQPFALVVDGTDSALTEVTPPPAGVLHVGDLDSTTRLYSNGWTATVTVGVHDAGELAVSGVTVSGSWGTSTSTVTCTTDSTGRCSITSARFGKSTASTTFTVKGLAKASWTYDATKNHDPDGDSNGTTITVRKP